MFETGRVPRSQQAQAAHRWIAVGLGLVAIAAIVGGLITRQVLVDETGDLAMNCGLKACDACYGGECITTTTIALTEDTAEGGGKASAAWGWSGTIGWWAAVVAALGLLLAVAMVATGKYVRLPLVSPTTIALVGGGVALICGCIFVATKPEGVGVTRVGWTFWAFGGGVIGAIVGSFLLSRQLAAIEPEFDPGDSPADAPEEPWQDM